MLASNETSPELLAPRRMVVVDIGRASYARTGRLSPEAYGPERREALGPGAADHA
jgi:hypothetical protein